MKVSKTKREVAVTGKPDVCSDPTRFKLHASNGIVQILAGKGDKQNPYPASSKRSSEATPWYMASVSAAKASTLDFCFFNFFASSFSSWSTYSHLKKPN